MSYEPTKRDLLNGRSTPEDVLEHAVEETKYQMSRYSPYAHPEHSLDGNSELRQFAPTPVDRRTTAEKTKDLFAAYGGLPGQRTSPKSK